jgi:hypothetical protein
MSNGGKAAAALGAVATAAVIGAGREMAHVGPQLAGQAGHMAEISLSKAATVAEGVSGSLGSGASSIGSRPDKFATSINLGAGIVHPNFDASGSVCTENLSSGVVVMKSA